MSKSKYADVVEEMTVTAWDEHNREEAYYVLNPPKWLKELVGFAFKAGQWSRDEAAVLEP